MFRPSLAKFVWSRKTLVSRTRIKQLHKTCINSYESILHRFLLRQSWTFHLQTSCQKHNRNYSDGFLIRINSLSFTFLTIAERTFHCKMYDTRRRNICQPYKDKATEITVAKISCCNDATKWNLILQQGAIVASSQKITLQFFNNTHLRTIIHLRDYKETNLFPIPHWKIKLTRALPISKTASALISMLVLCR